MSCSLYVRCNSAPSWQRFDFVVGDVGYLGPIVFSMLVFASAHRLVNCKTGPATTKEMSEEALTYVGDAAGAGMLGVGEGGKGL